MSGVRDADGYAAAQETGRQFSRSGIMDLTEVFHLLFLYSNIDSLKNAA